MDTNKESQENKIDQDQVKKEGLDLDQVKKETKSSIDVAEKEDTKTTIEEHSIGLDGNPNEGRTKQLSKEIDNRYSITEKGKKTLYSYSNDPETVAFTEKDNKLTANDNNPSITKNMVEVAEAKGWDNITVTGDKDFKRDVWLEAKAKGIEVKGYEPNEQDERKLERLLEKQNSIEPDKDNKPDKEASAPNDNNKLEEQQTRESKNEVSQDQKEKDLKSAYKTLDKNAAIEKHPELKEVYKVEPSASAFYKSKGGNKEQEEEFKSKATDKAIEELAAGRKVPEFDASSYKEPKKQTETRQDREIDYD